MKEKMAEEKKVDTKEITRQLQATDLLQKDETIRNLEKDIEALQESLRKEKKEKASLWKLTLSGQNQKTVLKFNFNKLGYWLEGYKKIILFRGDRSTLYFDILTEKLKPSCKKFDPQTAQQIVDLFSNDIIFLEITDHIDSMNLSGSTSFRGTVHTRFFKIDETWHFFEKLVVDKS